MSAYRAVLLALLVVGSVFAVTVPAGAVAGTDASPASSQLPASPQPSTPPVENVQTEQSENDSANASLGVDISSFMQSSAAEIGGAVESGMWTAEFNGTQNQSVQIRLVERRTQELRSELQTLQQQRDQLIAQHEAGEISETRYKAKISNLLGRINALQSAINTTAPRARQVGADVSQYQSMREQAKNLSGPEISAIARNTSGVGLGTARRGPPENAAAATNGTGVGATSGNGNGNQAKNGNGNQGNGNAGGNGNGNAGSNGNQGNRQGPPSNVDVGGDQPVDVNNPVENGTGNDLADDSTDVTGSDASDLSTRFRGVSMAGTLARTVVGTLF